MSIRVISFSFNELHSIKPAFVNNCFNKMIFIGWKMNEHFKIKSWTINKWKINKFQNYQRYPLINMILLTPGNFSYHCPHNSKVVHKSGRWGCTSCVNQRIRQNWVCFKQNKMCQDLNSWPLSCKSSPITTRQLRNCLGSWIIDGCTGGGYGMFFQKKFW